MSPGMMRSRKSGCLCLDCDGPQIATRASEKRAWAPWRNEYEDRPEDEARGCPKGGLACRCHLHNESGVGDDPTEGVYSIGQS